MQNIDDSTRNLYHEIRVGNIEKVREVITKYGLSHRPEWSHGYTLLRESLEYRQIDIAKLFIVTGSKLNSKTSRTYPSNTPLHFAIVNGDLEVVRLLIVKGANVNAINDFGETPLHEAVRKKNMEATELLVRYGAYVNARSSFGEMAIHIAIKKQCFQIAEYLIKCGADVNSGDKITENLVCYPPLHLAVVKGSEEIVKLLLTGGARVNGNGTDKTPLHIAAERGYSQIAEYLVEGGADVNYQCTSAAKKGYTPMHFAVEKGSDKIVELLLRSGANVNDKGKDNITPLHIAAERGYSQIAEYLVEGGADVNYQCTSAAKKGYTPMHFAVEKGSDKIVELLLRSGANVNDKGKDNITPLHIAIERGYSQIAEYLVEGGADVNYQCTSAAKKGYTPMHFAVEKGSDKIVELLLRSGANVNDKGKDNITPLHIAIERGYSQIAEYLVEGGADVNYQCTSAAKKGYTPMHFAVEKGSDKIVELLLRSGANVNDKGKDNITPLHIAIERGYSQIAEYLVEGGADVNYQCTSAAKKGYTPMHFAVEKGSDKIVELLLRSGANVNDKGKDNITPLHIAAKRGYSQIAEYLLEHGADFTSICTSSSCDGLTPLHFAVVKGSIEVASILLKYGASADTQDKTGKTILVLAVEKGHSAIVEHILKHCPDLNNQNNRNSLIAAVSGHGEEYTKITKNLLRYGFSVSSDDVINQELLITAVKKGYVSIVESLISYGADVNTLYKINSSSWYYTDLKKINLGCTLLHVAVINKQEELATLLVKCEADVNARDLSGKAPIYYATKNSDLKITKLLLSSKANLLVHPELLLIAAQEKSKEVIEVLLEHGADVNFSDDAGFTALHVIASREKCLKICDEEDHFKVRNYNSYLNIGARESCDEDDNIKGEIAKLLLSRGANVNATTKFGTLSLHAAAKNGYAKVIAAILEYNADVNYKGEKGISSLHMAAMENHLEVVETLLKFGAIIDSTDENGFTPLHYASRNRNKSIVSALLDHGSDVNIACNNNNTPLILAKTAVSTFYWNVNAYCDSDDDDYNSLCRGVSSHEKTVDILENHIVKLETASLYVSRKNLQLINQNELLHLRSKCKDELANLSCVNVGNSKISWYDILTKSVHHLTSLLGNENIVLSLRSDNYKTEFPIYGSLICSRFRMAEKRRKLLEEFNDYCFYIFAELPWECTWRMLSNLTDEDIQNLLYACQPTKICSPLIST